MKVKGLLSMLSLVMVVSLMGVTGASAAGGATVAVTNLATSDMTLTLDTTAHMIHAGGGQAAISVPAGSHTYKITIAGWPDNTGKVTLADGQTLSLAARMEKTGPVFDANGKVVDQSTFSLIWVEYVTQPTGVRLPVQAIPSGHGSLVFDNYMGVNLTVDIGGDTVFIVPVDGRLQISAVSGPYRFTASAAIAGAEATYNGVALVQTGKYTGLGFAEDMNIAKHPSSAEKVETHKGEIVRWNMLVTSEALP